MLVLTSKICPYHYFISRNEAVCWKSSCSGVFEARRPYRCTTAREQWTSKHALSILCASGRCSDPNSIKLLRLAVVEHLVLLQLVHWLQRLYRCRCGRRLLLRRSRLTPAATSAPTPSAPATAGTGLAGYLLWGFVRPRRLQAILLDWLVFRLASAVGAGHPLTIVQCRIGRWCLLCGGCMVGGRGGELRTAGRRWPRT